MSEILRLEWEWVDLDANVLRRPEAETPPVSLASAAVRILGDLKALRPERKYVIEGRRKGHAMVNLQKPWRRIRTMADLPDVRLHDLRHTFAGVGAGLGVTLPLLGRLLGHAQAATASRYAHLAHNSAPVAANAIGVELERMIAGSSVRT